MSLTDFQGELSTFPVPGLSNLELLNKASCFKRPESRKCPKQNLMHNEMSGGSNLYISCKSFFLFFIK